MRIHHFHGASQVKSTRHPPQKVQFAALPSRLPTTHSQARKTATRALGDAFKSLFDFESWAPRSSRIWRLQQYSPPVSEDAASGAASDTDMSVLSDRLNQLRDASPPIDSTSSSSMAVADKSSSIGSNLNSKAQLDASSSIDATGSFSDADDAELSAALGRRISQIATSTGSFSSMDEEEERQPLTGPEIRELLLTKYGKQYDLSFVRRDVPGMKTFVCLNIMWLHLEQRSFKMSPQQYMDKLDGVAALVNALGQTNKVRAFLQAPAKSQKGLPRRPVVGTAISIRFDLEQSVIDEWFGQGYD